jgi:hypothetical protein
VAELWDEKVLIILFMFCGVYFLTAGSSLALPECSGSPGKGWRWPSEWWSNCRGELVEGYDRYVGEWKKMGKGTEVWYAKTNFGGVLQRGLDKRQKTWLWSMAIWSISKVG